MRLPNAAGVRDADAGNPISNLFVLPSPQEAQAFSAAARQHYGDGFGGGGPLPAHNIIQFSTSGVGFQFW